jgi:hypothetical protein
VGVFPLEELFFDDLKGKLRVIPVEAAFRARLKQFVDRFAPFEEVLAGEDFSERLAPDDILDTEDFEDQEVDDLGRLKNSRLHGSLRQDWMEEIFDPSTEAVLSDSPDWVEMDFYAGRWHLSVSATLFKLPSVALFSVGALASMIGGFKLFHLLSGSPQTPFDWTLSLAGVGVGSLVLRDQILKTLMLRKTHALEKAENSLRETSPK